MALNDVRFIKGSGNVGAALPNEDHVSGILAYLASPAETEDEKAHLLGSIEDAEALGISSDDARYKEVHYQIQEFFRINPNAELWIYISVIPAEDAYTWAEIENLVNATNGKIRQIAVIINTEFDQTHVAAIQAVLTKLESEHKPLSALYSADMTGLELSALPDLRTLLSAKVSVVISQDGENLGNTLYNALAYSVPCTGAVLGAISLAAVHESIAWIEKFKMSGTELDTIAFANGDLYSETSQAVLNALNTKGFIFLRKHIGISGSFLNDSHTCAALTTDYAYIELNRTIDKATRNIRTFLLSKLNSPLEIDATAGTLSIDTVKFFENLAGKPLEQMQKDGELSGYKVVINPNQNVLVTSSLAINVTLVAKGVARNIVVTIGYGISI